MPVSLQNALDEMLNSALSLALGYGVHFFHSLCEKMGSVRKALLQLELQPELAAYLMAQNRADYKFGYSVLDI